MSELSKVQKAIDEKRIDTRSLNKDQKLALDNAFKTGDLSGYGGVEEYEKLINLGAMSVAQGKLKRLKPLESSTGITRGDVVLAGTAGLSMLPYLTEREALLDSFVKNGFEDVYGIDKRWDTTGKIYQRRLGAMSNFAKNMKKVPGPLGTPVRAMGNLIGMLDDTVDFFRKAGKMGISKPLEVEIKSGLGAVGGAMAGTAAFDIGNLGADYIGATSKDLANLTDSQERKLPFAERMFINMVRAGRDELLWTGGALGLVPLVRGAKGMVKSALDLDKPQAMEIAKAVERMGSPDKPFKATIVDLIPAKNPGLKGAFQSLVKKMFKTIGVYPFVSGPRTDFNEAFNASMNQEQFLKTMDNLSLPPMVNLSVLNYAGVNQIKREFKNVWKVIDDEYGRFRSHYEEIGNPTFIPLTNIRKNTQELIERLKVEYSQNADIFTQLEKGVKDLTVADDPMINYIRYLNSISDPNAYLSTGKAGYARLSDMLGLSKMLTQAYSGSRFKVVDNEVIRFKKAFEQDVNSLGEATNRNVLKDDIFKNEYNELLNSQGAEAAEAFLDKNIVAAKSGLKQLQEANAFFALVLRPYEKQSVARKLMKADQKLFASKGIDMTGIESISPGEVFEKVIKGTLKGGDPLAIMQLKQILGVTDSSYDILAKDGSVERTVKIPNSPESQAVWNQFVKQWVFDSWNKATANPIKLRGSSMEEIASEASRKGLIRKSFNPLDAEVEQRVRAKTRTDELLKIAEIDAKILTQGDGVANLNEQAIKDHDFGALNIDKFIENLGLNTAQGNDKIRMIFGGGEKGKKALEIMEDIIEVKRAIDLVPYTDPSSFIQRSLTLKAGSGSGIAATAVTSAVIGMGSTLKLILGARGLASIVASPKIAESVMGMNKSYRFALDSSKQSIFPTKGKKALVPMLRPRDMLSFGRALNSFFEAEGDEFRVDPANIDFEEVRQKILSLDPNVSYRGYDFGTMPKFTRDRIYPEYDVVKNLSPEQRQQGEQALQGAAIMGLSHQQFNAAANANPLEQAAEPAAPAAPQPQPIQGQAPLATGPAPTQQGVPAERGQNYQALFPNDALGMAIANRGQFNDGGLVEDAYTQADEILNA